MPRTGRSLPSRCRSAGGRTPSSPSPRRRSATWSPSAGLRHRRSPSSARASTATSSRRLPGTRRRVIEGFLHVADRIDHRLVLVGAPWRGRRAVIPPSASDRVQDLGAVTNAQLRALYRGAAAFIYPSLYEGFGLPVLEAMASGTAVVTSREGSLEEIAGAAALYVDPRAASAIGDAIRAVGTDPARRPAR